MRTSELQALRKGDRVSVTGRMDGKTFTSEVGTVMRGAPESTLTLIRFDTWRDGGHGVGCREWYFFEKEARNVNITVLPELKPEPPKVVAKKRPHGKQEYKGNGKHSWEAVTEGTERLRVPGGWLYRSNNIDFLGDATFVPVPEAVGYAV